MRKVKLEFSNSYKTCVQNKHKFEADLLCNMFEDYCVYEAFEFLNDTSKPDSSGVLNDYGETKDAGVSNTIPIFGHKFNESSKTFHPGYEMSESKLVTAHKQDNLLEDGQMNPGMCQVSSEEKHVFFESERKGRKIYEIGVHKGEHSVQNIKEHELNTKEHVRMSNMPVKKSFNDRIKYYTSHDDHHSGMSHFTNITYVHELERKGVLINSTGTMKSAEDLKEITHSHSDSEAAKILNDMVQDINIGNENINQYLFYGGTRTKKDIRNTNIHENPISEGKFTKLPSNRHEILKNRDIKTLEDSIAFFGLSSYLQKLEVSLEDVRRKLKKQDEHEEYFKQIDKEIQKLSFKYHPDKVKNRGGTEEEIIIAQKQQTALNATRTVLKLLNAAFIEDIDTDHKFGFYTKLSISSMCNEDELKQQIYEVIFKIGVISRIKQQNISEIRKFLIESKNCVKCYLENLEDFEKHRDLALFHLKCCRKGFKKLFKELKEVKEQCKSEKNGENMHFLIQRMASDSEKNLRMLKHLKRIAKESVKGNYQFFSPQGIIDPYFVLPLVSYTNVILMCNVMVQKASFWNKLPYFGFNSESNPGYRDDLGYLMHPYYLASYCSGNKCHEKTVLKIMDIKEFDHYGLKLQISKEEVELEFKNSITQVVEFMEYKFKIENYNEAATANLLMLDLKKCMTMMTEFEAKQEELSKGIEEFQKKTAKMDEKYEKFDKMMEESEELNKKFKERLEKSKQLREKVTNALSDHL